VHLALVTFSHFPPLLPLVQPVPFLPSSVPQRAWVRRACSIIGYRVCRVRVHPDGHILLHDEKAARALRRRRRGLPEAELLHCEDELLHLGVCRVRVLNGFNPHTEVAFAICDKPLGDPNGISQMQMYNNNRCNASQNTFSQIVCCNCESIRSLADGPAYFFNVTALSHAGYNGGQRQFIFVFPLSSSCIL
jgi:hypothetical protein